MAILTLTSDWGTKDYYVSAVKGKILSLLPETTIVDITHEIEPFNSIEAAYIIKNAYKNFPEGTKWMSADLLKPVKFSGRSR